MCWLTSCHPICSVRHKRELILHSLSFFEGIKHGGYLHNSYHVHAHSGHQVLAEQFSRTRFKTLSLMNCVRLHSRPVYLQQRGKKARDGEHAQEGGTDRPLSCPAEAVVLVQALKMVRMFMYVCACVCARVPIA